MPAYWVARSRINDPVAYKRYTDQVPAILAEFGGKVLARGGDFRILEGTDKYHRFIVVEFASLDDAEACWASEAYQSAANHRKNGAGDVELILVDSGDATN
ncbi:MAG: DUF1330 domain-containing protein [Hyphomicrobiaceae bacterium]